MPEGLHKDYRELQAEVAERKRVEEEREQLIAELRVKTEDLNQRNEDLLQRNVEMERFTYTVSHDLKSPLVTIKGFLGFLRNDVATGQLERVNESIDHIAKASDKMSQLLEELLELSRAGRLIYCIEAVSLAEVAQEAIELVAGEISERRVAVEVDPHLPVVQGDRARLLQVCQNLISNAVKYMGSQTRPRIELGGRLEAGSVICHVRDNGIGIQAEQLATVFELFHQLDPEMEGTGIGLALVKRIVDVHGGRLWVESAGKDKGSTFYFTLPSEGV